MKFRTKWSEFIKRDPLHIGLVIIYAVGFGIAINFVVNLLVSSLSPLRGLILPVPFTLAGGLRIAEALDRFSGKEMVSAWTSGQTSILVSILVCYVISLPLFVWGMRQRALFRQNPGGQKFPMRIALALGISASFLGEVCLVATVPPFIALSVKSSMQSAQTVQSNKDALISDVNYAALRAQSFYYMDVQDGGGGGKWTDIVREGNPTLGIEEIAPTEPVTGRVLGDFFPQQPSHFILKVHAQDSLTVWGVGHERGDVEDFVNQDGQRGKLQVSITVTPKNVHVTSDN